MCSKYYHGQLQARVHATPCFFGERSLIKQWDTYQKQINCFGQSGQWVPKAGDPGNALIPQTVNVSLPNSHCAITSVTTFEWTLNPTCFGSIHKINQKIAINEVCNIMKGRNLMLVGDSLTNQFGASMIYALFESNVKITRPIVNVRGISQSFEIPCSNLTLKELPSFMIHIHRNDLLTLSVLAEGTNREQEQNRYEVKGLTYVYEGLRTGDYPWFDAVGNTNISLLVLNRGAHFESIGKTVNDIDKVLTALKLKFPDVSVVWRNTARGHTLSERKQHPNAPRSREEMKNLTILDFPKHHHWEDFHAMNAAIYDLISVRHPGVLYLDIATSTEYRADRHLNEEDGLHYCIPGPIDNWVNLFWNAIKLSSDFTD